LAKLTVVVKPASLRVLLVKIASIALVWIRPVGKAMLKGA